jgi:hypothetical protein
VNAIPIGLVPIALAGLLALAVLWRRPQYLVLGALLIILFVRTLAHFISTPLVGSLDDLAVVLVAARAVAAIALGEASHIRWPPGSSAFGAFLVLGLLGDLFRPGPDLGVAAPGLYLAGKGILFGLSAAQFEWSDFHIRRAVRGAAAIIFLVLVCCALNALSPVTWARVFGVGGGVNERYGIASLIGPFVHPFDLAFVSSLGATAILAYRQRVRRSRLSLVLLAGLGATTVLSLRRKDLLGLLAAGVLVLYRGRSVLALSVIVIVAPVVVIFAWQDIVSQITLLSSTYFVVNSDQARTVLTLGAVTIASKYLPLGGGFGYFGSRTAATSYSPEYHALHYESVYGLGPGEKGVFLTDTSWPAILGETGYLGAAAFVIGLLLMARSFIRADQMAFDPLTRFLALTGLAWLVLICIQSSGAAVFSSPPMFPFLFALCGILHSRAAALASYSGKNTFMKGSETWLTR